MARSGTVAGAAFFGLGAALVATGSLLPPGIGGLLGAGFFPQAIGAVMVPLALGLIAQTLRGREEANLEIANLPEVACVAGLLLAYLLLWGVGPFVLRTSAFLVALLRFLGQDWKITCAGSAALTVFAYLAFDMGLNVSLN